MNTELYIENYRLDITTDISALLNFAIDDIKDFSARSTTWSRTIVLPGTANNNRLFGHIFQVGQSNLHNRNSPNVGFNFNAARSAQCVFFQDQLQVFKGVLRLLQINISDGFQGNVEYEVSVFGNLVGLNVALSGAYLGDLDFSAYDHVYNDSNIVASWDNPGGTGVYYPLIDYGTYSTNKHDWDIKTFRPALHVREYIDKIITAAGYRWSCTLFDTARFKKLVIPQNKKDLRTNATTIAKGDVPLQQPVITDSVTQPAVVNFGLVSFQNFVGSAFSMSVSSSTPPPGINTQLNYTDTPTLTLKFEWSITGHYYSQDNINFYIRKNTAPFVIPGSSVVLPATYIFGNPQPDQPFTISGTANVTFQTGDTLEFIFDHVSSTLNGYEVTVTNASFKITSPTSIPVPINPGDTVVMNDIIPQNIRQIDFLIGIVKLFNLYVYEDKNDPYLIYLTPYIDYYSKNTANSVDWTHKLNRNKVTKVKPMSELNAKIYKFKFKSDSDYYNDLYRKRYNEGYGDRTFDSEFEFTQQTSEFEIVFSATPLIGYLNEDKVYSTIFKRTGSDASPTEENTDSNIRILQTKRITGVTSWQLKNGSTVLNTLTKYGYAGHLDDPDIPTNDLNFGAPKELFFILTAGSLSNNQFNVYWSNYMAEITDKNSKLVVGNFYLTAKDILSLDFSKYVYVDGIAFRLNAIKDYDATTPNDCVVELFKINTTSYTESVNPNGPPDGCYLLWSDEQTLDWDTDDALLYSNCQDNPGDGDTGGGGDTPPDPPTIFFVNWSFNKTGLTGTFKIYINGTLSIFETSTNSGSFIVNAGDILKTDIIGATGRTKHIRIANDVDGVIYDNTSTLVTFTHTETVDANKNYTIDGSIN